MPREDSAVNEAAAEAPAGNAASDRDLEEFRSS